MVHITLLLIAILCHGQGQAYLHTACRHATPIGFVASERQIIRATS